MSVFRTAPIGAIAIAAVFLTLSALRSGAALRPRDAAGSASTAVARPCGRARRPPRIYRHVVWIVMENKTFSQIIGSPNAPYINRLARECGLATNFSAETSPSLPDYIAMTSGSTQGITDDGPPSAHRLTVPSIFSQTGSRWRGLAESMPSNCFQTDTGLYAVRHNPAAYYSNLSGACLKQDVPLTRTVSLDARFTFVTPNLCNDMHACPTTGDDAAAQTRLGDKWLAGWLPRVLRSRNYVSRSTAIFVTWDESGGAVEHIATLVISPSTPRGTVSSQPFTHYSLLRTTEEMLGVRGRLGNAASAPSMRSAFHA